MKRAGALAISALLVLSGAAGPPASGYLTNATAPQAGGCPVPDRWNLAPATPLSRQWSTFLPDAPATVLTVAPAGSSAQLAEIEQAIQDSFGAWTGVSGTQINAVNFPGALAPLAHVASADSCTNDAMSNADGRNTICFNQSSMGFTIGVLAFTRIFVANTPGASVGSSPPAAFAGQILDADTLFRNDGEAAFATPEALATTQGQGAYDLESLLAHELGHWLGLAHSAVWRAMMFPYAPPPGQFLGSRPTAQAPDGPLSDDDRAGIRLLYPDPNDAVNVGSIRGRVVPANPFALAALPAPAPGSSVTGIFGAQVVAVDADTSAVIAGAFSGWSCDPSNPAMAFDGSFDLERLPVGHDYLIYAEPLVGLASPGDFGDAFGEICSSSSKQPCAAPAPDTNFNPRMRPASP